MPFWTAAQGRDPKRKFRFLLTISSLPDGGQWFVKTSDRPSLEVASTEHKFLNHTFYYPGSVTWNEVSVTLVDPVDPDLQYALADVLRGAGYYVPVNNNQTPGGAHNDHTTISKSKATTALGNVTIAMIDSDGQEIETWTLNNPFITGVENSNLEYGTDDLADTTIKFRYDWASLSVDGGQGQEQYSYNTPAISPSSANVQNNPGPTDPVSGGIPRNRK